MTTTYEYNIGTGNDGNLMPIKIFKDLFLDTKLTSLNKSIAKNVVFFHITTNVYHKLAYPK